MRTKRRPKYIEDLVSDTNKRLKRLNIKDTGDTLFSFVSDLLLKKNMYEGYNFYKKKTTIINGEHRTYLGCPTQEELKAGEWDCLQIY